MIKSKYENDYVITIERQHIYLRCLGFEYKKRKVDSKNPQKYVWFYEKTEELLNCIEFYAITRAKTRKNQNK